MVEVHYQGRTGNHLFQYAFARQLAEQFGYWLGAKPISWFPNTSETIRGKLVREPTIEITENLYDSSQTLLSWEEMNRQWLGKRVVLKAHFEQSRLYLPVRDKIRQWFQFRDLRPQGQTALHLRGADVRHVTLQEAEAGYYDRALALVNRDRTVIVTDDPEWDYVKSFGFPVRSTNEWHDFRFIACASEIIIGRSTFAWWAAFLSPTAKLIIQPEPTCGARSQNENPGFYLGVPDWVRLPCELGWNW